MQKGMSANDAVGGRQTGVRFCVARERNEWGWRLFPSKAWGSGRPDHGQRCREGWEQREEAFDPEPLSAQ